MIVCGLQGVGLRTVEQHPRDGDHVVLVGLGAVGLRVLEGLRALGREWW